MPKPRCQSFFEFATKGLASVCRRYGLAELGRRSESHGCFVRLANSTTGIELSYEPFDGGLFVQVSELTNGEFPDYPVFIREDTVLRTFDLQDIREVRGEERFIDDPDNIEAMIAGAASALEESGGKVLSGDFSEFKAAREVVRARAKCLQGR